MSIADQQHSKEAKNTAEGLGDGSVDKALAAQVWGPKFETPVPILKGLER